MMNTAPLANMQTFSLSDTIQAAEQTKYLRVRNELLGYTADQEKALAERRKKKREIEEMYAGMPARIEKYREIGMHKEATETITALLTGKRQELAMFEIVAQAVTKDTWDRNRQDAIESGMIEADEMPVEFSQEWINHWLQSKRGELKVLETTYAELDDQGEETGRTMTRERVQQDGRIVEDNQPYEASGDRNARSGPGGGKAWEFSAADSNALLAQAKIQFDAILDDNGNFVGIRGEGDRALGELMERASDLMNEAGGPEYLPHAGAIAQAGREQGLKIKKTGDPNALNPLNLTQP
jgi:hypothetical protein